MNPRPSLHQRAKYRPQSELNAKGADVAFDVTKGNPRHVTDDSLDRLSSANRNELTNAITEHSAVSEEEGNS